MPVEFEILDENMVQTIFNQNEARLMAEVDTTYGAKINALNLSETEKQDIKENIFKIIDISKKYISGIEQRILHPANYNPQNAERMREEIINQLGGQAWLEEFGIDVSSKESFDIYRDNIINALLDGPTPWDDIITYVGNIYQAATLHDQKIEESIAAGLKQREENNTSFPEIFDDRSTIYIQIPQIQASLVQAQDFFMEISDAIEGVSAHIEKDEESFRLRYELSNPQININISKDLRLNAFFQKTGSLLKSTQDEGNIDFSDLEFMNLFFHEPRKMIAAIAELRELKKSRGISKNNQNKNILNVLNNNELLFLHMGIELKNHPDFTKDVPPQRFQELFMITLDDLKGKYNTFYESLNKAAAKNKTENTDNIDMLVFSNDPWQIATQSTYQDWQSCMHALSNNFDYVKKDIGYGTIICYGRSSTDPAHNLVRYSLKPYTNQDDNNKVIYRFPREYGKLFEGFRDNVADIFNQIAGIKETYGMHRINPGLYSDGLAQVFVFDKNNDQEYRQAYLDGHVRIKDMPRRLVNR